MAYGHATGSMFHLGNALGAAGSGKGAPAAKPAGAAATTSVEKGQSGLVAPWGPGNDFPQRVLADIAKSTILGPVLDWKTRATAVRSKPPGLPRPWAFSR